MEKNWKILIKIKITLRGVAIEKTKSFKKKKKKNILTINN
jgi:hypothetical protein